MHRSQHCKKGFTLVETLVAITVLLLVIIGPITVAQKGIQSAFYANTQVTAVFLAQEAIEAMRELRDSAALEAYADTGGGNTWSWVSTSLQSDCTSSSGCAFDVIDRKFETCTSNSGCEILIDQSTGRYTHAAGGLYSGFTRKVYVTSEGNAVRVKVVVLSQASFGGNAVRPITVETWLYDHYQRYEEG